MTADEAPLVELLRTAYPELRRQARRLLSRERGGHTLQPTALANEVVARILRRKVNGLEDGQALIRYGLTEMRSILADSGRRRKQGLSYVSSQKEESGLSWPGLRAMLTLAEALEGLEKVDARAREVVELRYFLQLTIEETAEYLNISVRTVNENWTFARAWLADHLGK